MILPLTTRHWLSAGDVKIRYPGVIPVDALHRKLPDYVPKGLRLVHKELDRQINFYAPWWLAWLYRYLPYRFAWHRGKDFDVVLGPPYFLWSVSAPRWHVAWLPKRRQAGRYKARWGVIRYGETGVIRL